MKRLLLKKTSTAESDEDDPESVLLN